jgi:hypothetical protein
VEGEEEIPLFLPTFHFMASTGEEQERGCSFFSFFFFSFVTSLVTS